MTEHELKTWPEWYEPSLNNDKPYEIRKNDRDYKVGDVLHLREYRPAKYGFPGSFTGRSMRRDITHILPGGKFGVQEGYVILSLGPAYDKQ